MAVVSFGHFADKIVNSFYYFFWQKCWLSKIGLKSTTNNNKVRIFFESFEGYFLYSKYVNSLLSLINLAVIGAVPNSVGKEETAVACLVFGFEMTEIFSFAMFCQ